MAYLEELLPEFRKGAKIRIKSWSYGFYLQTEGGAIVDQNKQPYNLTLIDLKCNNWELYQEPIDWDYIIKNKCLCWFWDDEEKFTVMDKLYEIRDDNEFKFVRNFKGIKLSYIQCRPVRRDEVTFYEDKKDE